MIAFKYYFKIIKNYLPLILLYAGITLAFAIFSSTQNQSSSKSFVDSMPKIGIINNDNGEISKSLVNYLNKNTKIIKTNNYQDAMFYRDITALVTIPINYSSDFMKQKKVSVNISKTEDISANQVELLVNKYLKLAAANIAAGYKEKEVIYNVNKIINDSIIVDVLEKEATNEKYLAAYLYSFSSYSILAICISGIGLIMLSYNKKGILSRNNVSPVSYSKINLALLSGHFVFALCVWLLFNITALIIYPNVVISQFGFFLAINSLLYCLVALSIGFLCGKLIKNQNVNSAVMNILALGSSFLSGAFVPQSLLSDSVLKISQFIPAYWFVKSNDLIASSSTINSNIIKQLLSNGIVLLLFIIIINIISNIVSRYKQKV